MKQTTAQQRFWNWFRQHEAELLDFEADRERIFDALAGELQKVHPQLTFEFGPKEAAREFVISASGIRAAFPAVTALTESAPHLERWRITAFRPRRDSCVVEFRGKRADPEDVQFTLLDNGEIAGLYLFIPGFRDNDSDWQQIGYLLLDGALGEYDVETRLGLIEMFSPQTDKQGERRPFTELPPCFDKLVERLEGSGKSS